MNTIQNKYQAAEPVSQHFLPLAEIVHGFFFSMTMTF